MAFNGLALLASIILSVALTAVGFYVVYLVVKAAVRNGTIEAYIRLRREKLYPPE